MTDRIEIKSKDDWLSAIDMKDNADFMYFLSQLKAGCSVKVAIDVPELYCEVKIFSKAGDVFET